MMWPIPQQRAHHLAAVMLRCRSGARPSGCSAMDCASWEDVLMANEVDSCDGFAGYRRISQSTSRTMKARLHIAPQKEGILTLWPQSPPSTSPIIPCSPPSSAPVLLLYTSPCRRLNITSQRRPVPLFADAWASEGGSPILPRPACASCVIRRGPVAAPPLTRKLGPDAFWPPGGS